MKPNVSWEENRAHMIIFLVKKMCVYNLQNVYFGTISQYYTGSKFSDKRLHSKVIFFISNTYNENTLLALIYFKNFLNYKLTGSSLNDGMHIHVLYCIYYLVAAKPRGRGVLNGLTIQNKRITL